MISVKSTETPANFKSGATTIWEHREGIEKNNNTKEKCLKMNKNFNCLCCMGENGIATWLLY